MKKRLIFFLLFLLVLSACGRNSSQITVISREEGSGTRSAFVRLSGVLEHGIDRTYPRAEVSSSTAVVMQTVMGNPNAIGYISLGSLQENVKALRLDGIAISPSNIAQGSYPLARDFLLVTAKKISPQAEDFLAFALSGEGQKIIGDLGYVPIEGGNYTGSQAGGILKVAGSSSLAPVLEKLAAAYEKKNPRLEVQIQITDSSAGIAALQQNLCDIAMSSRSLTEGELSQGLQVHSLCKDGIAVIVNLENPTENLSLSQLKKIFTGEIQDWSLLS